LVALAGASQNILEPSGILPPRYDTKIPDHDDEIIAFGVERSSRAIVSKSSGLVGYNTVALAGMTPSVLKPFGKQKNILMTPIEMSLSLESGDILEIAKVCSAHLT
jgi:hypothetical protein